MRLTDEQQAIEQRAGALKDAESLKVIAYAGTGKTTTLQAVADSRSGQGVYLAFNRSIAQIADPAAQPSWGRRALNFELIEASSRKARLSDPAFNHG